MEEEGESNFATGKCYIRWDPPPLEDAGSGTDGEGMLRIWGQMLKNTSSILPSRLKPSRGSTMSAPNLSFLHRQQLIRKCPILSNIEPKQIRVWFLNRRDGWDLATEICLSQLPSLIEDPTTEFQVYDDDACGDIARIEQDFGPSK